MTNDLEKIKRKIKALLEMNTSNGCTEHEATIALQKAEALMLAYRISQSELENPFAGEKIVAKSNKGRNSAYKIKIHHGELGRLFGVIAYGNKYENSAFGFESDVDLYLFFVDMIDNILIDSINSFKETDTFKLYSLYKSPKTIVASYIRGFLLRIAQRINDMYQARQQERNGNTASGIILVKKEEKVKAEFDLQFPKMGTRKDNGGNYIGEAFRQGAAKGDEVQLTQGIAGANAKMLALNQ